MNKPVAWMLNGILHECDPSDWAKEQYPDQDVIPLYTHPVKELTDEVFDKIFADGKRLGVLETEDKFYKSMQLTDEEMGGYEVVGMDEYDITVRMPISAWQVILRKASEK